MFDDNPFEAYKTTSLEARAASANPNEIVRMLLEGLLDELYRTGGFMERKSYEDKGKSINKCLNIVHGLDSMLDMTNGGEIATNLHNLYLFCSNQLVKASIENSPKALEPIINVIQQIREGWENL